MGITINLYSIVLYCGERKRLKERGVEREGGRGRRVEERREGGKEDGESEREGEREGGREEEKEEKRYRTVKGRKKERKSVAST